MYECKVFNPSQKKFTFSLTPNEMRYRDIEEKFHWTYVNMRKGVLYVGRQVDVHKKKNVYLYSCRKKLNFFTIEIQYENKYYLVSYVLHFAINYVYVQVNL